MKVFRHCSSEPLVYKLCAQEIPGLRTKEAYVCVNIVRRARISIRFLMRKVGISVAKYRDIFCAVVVYIVC